MELYFKNVGSDLSPAERGAIERKLQKLSKYVREGSYEARMTVEVKRNSSDHSSPTEWQSVLNLDVAGERFNSGANGSSADSAIMKAGKDLKTELKKASTKARSINRRKGFFWKRLRTNS